MRVSSNSISMLDALISIRGPRVELLGLPGETLEDCGSCFTVASLNNAFEQVWKVTVDEALYEVMTCWKDEHCKPCVQDMQEMKERAKAMEDTCLHWSFSGSCLCTQVIRMKTDPTRFAAFSPFSPLNNLRRRLKIAAARAFMYRSSVLPYASEMWYPRLPISITEVKS